MEALAGSDPWRGRVVGVTGATGFVGRAVVRALEARGARPVAIARRPDRASYFADRGVEVRQADVLDLSSIRMAMEGLDALVCCAGRVSLGGQPIDEVMQVNVQGTRHQLEAAAEASVRRVVLMSSVEAYATRRDRRYAEESPLWSEQRRVTRLSAYAQSKASAERAATEVASRADLELSILRPGAIHGAFDSGTLTFWLRRILALPVTPYPTHTYFTSVYVGDLADAACLALIRPEAIGEAFNVCGAPDVTFWDLKEAWRAAGGRVPRVVLPFPLPVRVRFDITKAERLLGWRNRPLEDGFREMFSLDGTVD